MILGFIGADHEVTGSCHYLNVNGKHILVDYGMEQGRNYFENAPLPVSPAEIDFVLITHCLLYTSASLCGSVRERMQNDRTADLPHHRISVWDLSERLFHGQASRF